MGYLILSRNELFAELKVNRELEFSTGGIQYFISSDDKHGRYIWDESHQKLLFSGSLEDIFSFVFPNGYSLDKNIGQFNLEYLL